MFCRSLALRVFFVFFCRTFSVDAIVAAAAAAAAMGAVGARTRLDLLKKSKDFRPSTDGDDAADKGELLASLTGVAATR